MYARGSKLGGGKKNCALRRHDSRLTHPALQLGSSRGWRAFRYGHAKLFAGESPGAALALAAHVWDPV